uniref:Uncharacterized protein n=1 Tax=Hyaloperonospora arabidopsidis (strain Emoy2) TaxID=559515 RepID=M4BRH7_HYAAE
MHKFAYRSFAGPRKCQSLDCAFSMSIGRVKVLEDIPSTKTKSQHVKALQKL